MMDIEQIIDMGDEQLRETVLKLSCVHDEESEELLEILADIPELQDRIRYIWENLIKEKLNVVSQHRLENEQLDREFKTLTTDLARLKNESEQSSKKLSLLEKQITEAEQELQKANDELNAIINNQEGKLVTSKKQIETKKSQLAEDLERIKQEWNKKRSLVLDIISLIKKKGVRS